MENKTPSLEWLMKYLASYLYCDYRPSLISPRKERMTLSIADDNPGVIYVDFVKRFGEFLGSARAFNTDDWALDVCKHLKLDPEEVGWKVSLGTFQGLKKEIDYIQSIINKLTPYQEEKDGKHNA